MGPVNNKPALVQIIDQHQTRVMIKFLKKIFWLLLQCSVHILIQIHIMLDSNAYTMQQLWLGTISFCMPIYLLTNMHTDEAPIHMITSSVAIVTGRHTEYITRSEGYYGIFRSYARDTAVHPWAGSAQDDIMIGKGQSISHWWFPITNGQELGVLMSSLMLTWPSFWRNGQVAHDLRYHEVIVISL